MKSVKVGLLQYHLEPEASREKALEHVQKLIEGASKNGAQILCLPERWNHRKGEIHENIEPHDSPTVNYLQKSAEEFGIYLIGGAIWVYNEDKTKSQIISNVFNPKGELIAIQQKLHLYLYEKSFFQPGKELKIIPTEFGKIGVAICFDMIFPEVARYYALNDVSMIFSPVLIREDGIENWHVYLKARALENRMPICAVNCVGQINERTYPGQSLLIDFKSGYETPSKLQIREAHRNKEDILIDTIDLQTSRKLREKRLAERLVFDNSILNFSGKKEI